MAVYWCTLILFVYFNVPPSICEEYDNIQLPNISCSPFDTCKLNASLTCNCDEHCASYGDCCADSPYRKNEVPKTEFLCQHAESLSYRGVYVKSVCPRRNTDEWVRQGCEETPTFDAIESKVPVFSTRSSVTYKNFYCALCNEDRSDLIFWDVDIGFDGDILNEREMREIIESLEYNEKEQSWGFWNSSNGKQEWMYCSLYPLMSSIIPAYRNCELDMTSECHPQWRDNGIRNMCSQYQSPLLSKFGQRYKNIHCALCNNVDVKELERDKARHGPTDGQSFPGVAEIPPGAGQGVEIPFIKASGPVTGNMLRINFGDVIKINIGNGKKTGKLKKECPEKHTYDEAFRRCAEMFCIGNRILRDGKCDVA